MPITQYYYYYLFILHINTYFLLGCNVCCKTIENLFLSLQIISWFYAVIQFDHYTPDVCLFKFLALTVPKLDKLVAHRTVTAAYMILYTSNLSRCLSFNSR